MAPNDSRRAYSWLWDSHICPKNSKWLQENLTDMDAKVKSMIKLIEEDADSFARRAEMYFKKRPELMKLVEDFYRAYRALAERYNHMTGELRHAHRTIAKAFPEQEFLPFELMNDDDDSPSKLRDPEKPGAKIPKSHRESSEEDVLVKYHRCLEKLSSAEKELDEARRDSKRLHEDAERAKIEVQVLKEALAQLETEKNAGLVKQRIYSEKISGLEAKLLFEIEEGKKGINERATFSEIEARKLREVISRLQLEKEVVSRKYEECLERVAVLENLTSVAEENVKVLKIQAEKAEDEICRLKHSLADMKKERDDLEDSNFSLKTEAEKLAEKIAAKDLELSKKQKELENLQKNLSEERAHHARVEASLENLQNLHSQSREDQNLLTLELRRVLRMLNDLEDNKCALEEEIKQVKNENLSLSQRNLSSSVSIEGMRSEILSLRDVKDRLEREASYHAELTDSLQKEISSLKHELETSNAKYRALMEQVEASGLSPSFLGASVKELRDEKAAAEISLADLNNELRISRERTKSLQESFDGEKATLAAEKGSLLSQLQAVTESLRDLVRKNAVLENSLSSARIELEGLRQKSKGLEEICRVMKEERAHILAERGAFASKLGEIENRLEKMERKCCDLHEEKEAMRCRAEELAVSLDAERQERINLGITNETKLSVLENQIRFLREEGKRKRKEFEEELERSLKSQFEVSILQRFVKEMEEKNLSLLFECKKHVEASKLADEAITELERERLEQKVETGLLLEEIERLRLCIYELFGAIEICPEENFLDEKIAANRILAFIDAVKISISRHEDDKQLLLVENSVLLALLEQLEAKAVDFENELDRLRVRETDSNRAYGDLQEAYMRVNRENTELLRVVSELKEEKYRVEEYLDAVLVECVEKGNDSVFLRGFAEEKLGQVSLLLGDLKRQVAENSVLKEIVRKMETEAKVVKDYNEQMKKDVVSTQGKLIVKEMRIEAAENSNTNLLRTIEELKSELRGSLQARKDLEKNVIVLSEVNNIQRKEIEGLRAEKTKLNEEFEEKTISRNSELEKKKNEYELWEAEAVPFYFDLQFLSINEILIKDKVHELTEVSRALEDENNSKALEILHLRGKIRSMEGQISSLRCQLSVYGPVVAALNDDIRLLEHNALLQKNRKAANHQEQEFSEGGTDPSRSSTEKFLLEDQTLISLQELVNRIKAVSKSMEETKTVSIDGKQEIKPETELLKLNRKNEPSSRRRRGYTIELSDTPKLHKIKTKSPPEARSRSLVKDIQQLSEISPHRTSKNIKEDDKVHEVSDVRRDQTIGESLKISYKMIERDSKHKSKNSSTCLDAERKSTRETNRARIVERLTCDAEELQILQATVETLRKKVQVHKKSRKAKKMDLDSVYEQLLESEETVVSLMDANDRLMKSIEECPSPDENTLQNQKDCSKMRRRRISEQAQKVSEKIFRLQLEIQKIQCMLLEFEGEKGKNKKMFKSKAIVLRDLIYNGVAKGNKKRQLCGCIRPLTTTPSSIPMKRVLH